MDLLKGEITNRSNKKTILWDKKIRQP